MGWHFTRLTSLGSKYGHVCMHADTQKKSRGPWFISDGACDMLMPLLNRPAPPSEAKPKIASFSRSLKVQATSQRPREACTVQFYRPCMIALVSCTFPGPECALETREARHTETGESVGTQCAPGLVYSMDASAWVSLPNRCHHDERFPAQCVSCRSYR